MGLEDREALKDASLKRFKTMDEAKDYVYYFLHISSASTKTKPSRRTPSRDQEETANVFDTSISQDDFRKEMQRLKQHFEEKLSIIASRASGSSNRKDSWRGRGRGYQQNDDSRNQSGYGRSRNDWGRSSRGRGGKGIGWNNPQQYTGNRDKNNSGAGVNNDTVVTRLDS